MVGPGLLNGDSVSSLLNLFHRLGLVHLDHSSEVVVQIKGARRLLVYWRKVPGSVLFGIITQIEHSFLFGPFSLFHFVFCADALLDSRVLTVSQFGVIYRSANSLLGLFLDD